MIELAYHIITYFLLYSRKHISLKITILHITATDKITEKFKNCFYSRLSHSLSIFIVEL